VRSDLHPAIQYLLLEAATEIHQGRDVPYKGQFPAAEAIDLPLAAMPPVLQGGPPFLQRHLPFWLAVLAQQLLVLLIPVLAVLYPLLRSFPLYTPGHAAAVFRLWRAQAARGRVAIRPCRGQGRRSGRKVDRLEERASRFRLPVSFRPLLR
jgi:hypothetical protein